MIAPEAIANATPYDSSEAEPYAVVFLQWAAAVGNEHGIWDMFLEHINYLEKKIVRRVKALPSIATGTAFNSWIASFNFGWVARLSSSG